MPRVCEFTGKRTTTGFKYTLRGRKKYLGGIGTKITSKTKRTFKPNIQTVNALQPNGSVKKVKASTAAIKNGLITKPLPRKLAWTRNPEAQAAAGKG